MTVSPSPNPIDPNDPGEQAQVVNVIQKLLTMVLAAGITLPPFLGLPQTQQSLAFLILTGLAALWNWSSHRTAINQARRASIMVKNLRAAMPKPSGANMTVTPNKPSK